MKRWEGGQGEEISMRETAVTWDTGILKENEEHSSISLSMYKNCYVLNEGPKRWHEFIKTLIWFVTMRNLSWNSINFNVVSYQNIKIIKQNYHCGVQYNKE